MEKEGERGERTCKHWVASLVFVLVAIEVARPLGGQWQRLTITMSSTRKSGAELSKLTLNNIKNCLVYSPTFLHSQGPLDHPYKWESAFHLQLTCSISLAATDVNFFHGRDLSVQFVQMCRMPIANWRLAPGCLPSPLCSLTRVEREGMRETDGGNPQIPFTFSFHGCLGVRRRRRCSNRPLVIFGCRCLSSAHRCNPSLLPHSLCCQIRHQIAQKSQSQKGERKRREKWKKLSAPSRRHSNEGPYQMSENTDVGSWSAPHMDICEIRGENFCKLLIS